MGVRAGVSEKVTFERRPEGLKGAGKTVSWKFRLGESLACLKARRRASVVPGEGAWRRGLGGSQRQLLKDLVGHGLDCKSQGKWLEGLK